MTVEIEGEGKNVSFSLDPPSWRWHSWTELPEADFPLVTVVNDKRCELYSDGTFAEVSK